MTIAATALFLLSLGGEGDRIVFIRGDRVLSCSLDGSEERVIASGFPGRLTSVSASPDGKKIAILTDLGMRVLGGDLHVINSKGGERIQLAVEKKRLYRQVEWAPDSSRVYASAKSGLDSMRPDGSDFRELCPLNGFSSFRVAPDGRWILLNRRVKGGRRPVLIDSRGGAEKALPIDGDPADTVWARSGEAVLYGLQDAGGCELRWHEPKTGKNGVLFEHSSQVKPFTYPSPVGEDLLVIKGEGLYLFTFEGEEKARLTPKGMAVSSRSHVRWIQGGKSVLIGNGERIYVCRIEHLQLTEVTKGSAPSLLRIQGE